jgi:hypothetical protein
VAPPVAVPAPPPPAPLPPVVTAPKPPPPAPPPVLDGLDPRGLAGALHAVRQLPIGTGAEAIVRSALAGYIAGVPAP